MSTSEKYPPSTSHLQWSHLLPADCSHPFQILRFLQLLHSTPTYGELSVLQIRSSRSYVLQRARSEQPNRFQVPPVQNNGWSCWSLSSFRFPVLPWSQAVRCALPLWLQLPDVHPASFRFSFQFPGFAVLSPYQTHHSLHWDVSTWSLCLLPCNKRMQHRSASDLPSALIWFSAQSPDPYTVFPPVPP